MHQDSRTLGFACIKFSPISTGFKRVILSGRGSQLSSAFFRKHLVKLYEGLHYSINLWLHVANMGETRYHPVSMSADMVCSRWKKGYIAIFFDILKQKLRFHLKLQLLTNTETAGNVGI